MWVSDANGICVFLNKAWTRFTGQPVSSGLGWGFLDMVHPEDRPGIKQAWINARAQLEPYQAEYRLRSTDGTFHWMIDTAAPQLSGNGALLGFVGSILDNSKRHAAELAQRQSERRLEIALNAAQLGTWEWDLATNEFLLSDTARSIFGFEPSGPISFNQLEAAIHPHDIAAVQAMSAAALDRGQRASEPYRYRIVRSDGEVRWIQAHGEAVFIEIDGTSKPVSYVGTFQDITEQVNSQALLQESEERLRLALEAGGIAVWELNTRTNAVTHSPELNALYGFPPDAVPSLAEFQSRYAPGEQERLAELGQQALARGETEIVTEVRHILPGGVVRWFYLRAKVATPTTSGDPRVIGVAMDVTSQKQAEERLQIVAHELQHRMKNSIAVIQTLAEQTFKGGKADPAALTVFQGRLHALAGATDLLTKSDWNQVDLQTLAEQVLNPYQLGGRIVLGGKQIQVPAKAATPLAMALHELATNAVKYGSLSNDVGQVHLTWSSSKKVLSVEWIETGGPPVREARKIGFGTRLLQRALFTGNDGSLDLEFKPEGVWAHLSIQVDDDTQVDAHGSEQLASDS
jgi:PAS domain S-box-containing protein